MDNRSKLNINVYKQPVKLFELTFKLNLKYVSSMNLKIK